MAEMTMSFEVDEALMRDFARAAKALDRSEASLLQDYMRGVVESAGSDHDPWFRSQVDASMAEAEDPSVVPIAHDDVLVRWTQFKATSRERSRRE